MIIVLRGRKPRLNIDGKYHINVKFLLNLIV